MKRVAEAVVLKPITPIEAVVQKLAVDAINVVIWAQADEALSDVVGRELPKLFPERARVAPAIVIVTMAVRLGV